MPGFDPAAFRAEQRRGEPRSQRTPDDPADLLSPIRERASAAANFVLADDLDSEEEAA